MGNSGREPYDRARLLEAAARARSRRRRPQAIALYRRVLAVERHSSELHVKLAPLLAEEGFHFDAWLSVRAAAEASARQGAQGRALLLYREAAGYLPGEYRIWLEIARLQRHRGQLGEALAALIRGAGELASRRRPAKAIYLLRHARQIEPWDLETCARLARLLARTDQAPEARAILGGLAERNEGRGLRRVRAAQLRLDPGPMQLWRWLRAALQRGGPVGVAAERGGGTLVPVRSRTGMR